MGVFQILTEQSKMPTGRLGRIMLRIMNSAHRDMTLWGLSKLQSCQKVLDVSCGGGNAVRLMAEKGNFERIYGIGFSQDAVSIATANNHKYIENGLVTVILITSKK